MVQSPNHSLPEGKLPSGQGQHSKKMTKALSAVVRHVWTRPDVKAKMKCLKGKASEFSRSDFIWHEILGSFSTMGNARVSKLMEPANYKKVVFPALQKVPARKRTAHIRTIFRNAKVRYANKKADWLAENVERIKRLGGWLRQKGRWRTPMGRVANWNSLRALRESEKSMRATS